MKKNLVFIFLFLSVSFCANAQGENMLLSEPEVLPRFGDGNYSLFKYLNENFVFSEEDKAQHIEGEMVVTFVVDTTGKISNVEIRKGLRPSINQKMKEIISQMPPWTPGRAEGRWINSRFSIAMIVESDSARIKPLF